MKRNSAKKNLLMAILLVTILFFVFVRLMDPSQIEDPPDETEEVEILPETNDADQEEKVESSPMESLLPEEKNKSKHEPGQAIGNLVIPVIDLDMPVIEHASAANLNRSLARMISTDLPGTAGNAVITGHRMYAYGSHFNRLDEIAVGDAIIFEDDLNRYIYEVEAITFVEPAEIWITMGTSRESLLTLVTCTPIARATHRLVVFSALIEKITL